MAFEDRKSKAGEAQGLMISLCLAKKKDGGYEKLLVLEVDRPETLMTVEQAKIIHEKMGTAIAHLEAMSSDPEEAQAAYKGPAFNTADIYPDGTSTAPEEKN